MGLFLKGLEPSEKGVMRGRRDPGRGTRGAQTAVPGQTLNRVTSSDTIGGWAHERGCAEGAERTRMVSRCQGGRGGRQATPANVLPTQMLKRETATFHWQHHVPLASGDWVGYNSNSVDSMPKHKETEVKDGTNVLGVHEWGCRAMATD